MFIIGFILEMFSRFYRFSVSKYKTYKIRKTNPKVLNIGYKAIIKGNVSLGDGTYVNGGEICAFNDSKVIIGKKCLISYDVIIRTDMHNFDLKDVPIIEQGNNYKDIVIGDNVWIGYGAYIMPGINIGEGAIIGARAVVTHDVEPFTIVAGVPARAISKR